MIHRPDFQFGLQYLEAALYVSQGFVAIDDGAGLLLAFTPCVLPMIPILSGIVVGGREVATRGRALMLSITYVLGMAITYAGAGVAAGLSGAMRAAALQNPWVLCSFAVLGTDVQNARICARTIAGDHHS